MTSHGRTGDMRDTWAVHRGTLDVRVTLAALTLGAGAIVMAVTDLHAALVGLGAVVAVAAALVHPMVLVGVLAFGVTVLESANGNLRWPGAVIAVAGALLLQLRDERDLPHVWAFPVLWIGLFVMSPWLFLVLAVPPAISIFFRHRSEMRNPPVHIEPGPLPPLWHPTVRELRVLGYRYVGTLWFSYAGMDERGAAVVFRLGDGRGYLLGTDGWLVGHAFGSRSFFSAPGRWTITMPHELGQHVATTDLTILIRMHRRVLGRLARMGIRPDRLTDEELLAFLVRQYELDSAARARAGPWTVVRALYDQERNLRQSEAPSCLLDSPEGRTSLERWALDAAQEH